MLAVIEIGFDPILRLGELTMKWQTIGVTLGLLVALAVAALMAPDFASQRQAAVIESSGARSWVRSFRPLRLDDMVLIIAGIVPGAVIGGRLVHALVFLDAYAAQPYTILDPSVGTLSLTGAVLGGAFSGAYVASLVGAPVRRWADAAAVPLLLAIALGKFAQFLGGGGQGLPFDGSWAVAFVGTGPWVGTIPEMPSHPAQIYEALWVLIGIPLVVRWAGPQRMPARVHRLVAWADRSAEEGRLFVVALSWFLLGRLLIGFTWRDDPVGPLNSEQAVALVVLVAVQLGSRLRARGEVPLPAP